MRLTGMGVEEACQLLISTLSVENLDRLEKELTRRVFGNEAEAKGQTRERRSVQAQ